MRTFCAAVIVLAAAIAPSIATAQLGKWTAHTSMRRVTDVTDADETVWVSTTGGVFRVSTAGEIIGTLTAVEGLHAVGGSTIEYDRLRSSVWLGYSDGVIDKIDVGDLTISSFVDISRATQFSRRGINRITVRGDSLLLCTDFGVVVFDPVKGEVRDSYTRFGAFSPGTATYDITVGPDSDGAASFWVATDQGVAVARIDSPNLQDPSQWTTEIPPVSSARSIAYFDGRIVVGTTADAFTREENGVYAAMGLATAGVNQLETISEDLLIGVTRFEIVSMHKGGAISTFVLDGFPDPKAVSVVDATLWVGDFGGGLLSLSLPPAGTVESVAVQDQYIPSGPFEGVFSDLFAAPDGSLWAGGPVGGGSGFHRLSPDQTWTDYVGDAVQNIGNFTSVSTDASGAGWAASEGGGAAQVTESGDVEIYNESNSSLLSVTGFPGFIIAGGVAGDQDGGIWVTTRGSSRPLHYRSAEAVWTALPPIVGEGLSSGATAYGKIYIDSFGQKWIVIREESSFGLVKGLAVLDTGNTPSDPSDDAFRFFGTRGGGGQGLPSRSVTAVVEDRDGLVWVGTQEGLAFFVNTGVVARDANAVAIWPQRSDRSEGAFLFLGLPVNDLAVDPANRLWIATNEGVRLIQAAEGGYEEVLRLRSASSPLLSDAVLSVEVVPGRGEVFFATAEGLVSVEIDAITAAASAGDLFVYPNPAVIGSGALAGVTIEGLVDETRMSILSPLGDLVSTMRTRGGRAVWDLRDASGRFVPSGVYIVIAVGENGEGASVGKVAVIR